MNISLVSKNGYKALFFAAKKHVIHFFKQCDLFLRGKFKLQVLPTALPEIRQSLFGV